MGGSTAALAFVSLHLSERGRAADRRSAAVAKPGRRTNSVPATSELSPHLSDGSQTSAKSRLWSLNRCCSVFAHSGPNEKRCQPHSPPATAVQDADALSSTPGTSAKLWRSVRSEGTHGF